MSAVGRYVPIVVLMVACKDEAREKPSAPFGYLDDAKLEQLRATCPTAADVVFVGDDRPSIAGLVYDCSWRESLDGPWNGVVISSRKKDRRIEDISITTKDRTVATRVFERFVGPVVPAAVRDELRRTIDQQDSQIRLEAKGGLLFKHDDGRGVISWSFSPYVPSE